MNNMVWPLHYISMLEPKNVVEMLTTTMWLYFMLFTMFTLILVIWV